MPAYSTPGVYVTEAPLSSLTPSTNGLSSAAFFGTAERGPTTPTLVSDWNSYKVLYGELKTEYDLGYAVYHFFANGGRACYVTRVVNATAATATKANIPFQPTGAGGASAGASAGLLTVTAVSPGTWGNTVTVQTLDGAVDSSSTNYGTFTLVVNVGGVEVERWPEVTLDRNGNRYVATVINTYSRFIRVSNVYNTATLPVAGTLYNTTVQTLTGGTQAAVIDTDYTSAFSKLDTVSGNLILNAVGQTSATVVSGLVSYASTRGDSFVIIDPKLTDLTLAELQATAANFVGISNGGYAAHYAPALTMVDPGKSGPGAIRATYPGGAIAGLFVRTEVGQTVAKAPAGYAADIRGALGLTVALSDNQIGTLYDGTPQVNSFKVIPGAGINVYGARTLTSATPDKFVNVRRTLNYLKFNLKELSQFAVFQNNDPNLWNKLNMTLSSFLSDFWRAGGLRGERAADAFYVLCDASNNTSSTIDQGIVNVQVGVALQYPAEFIVINLSQWAGGANAVESL